jgi:hypothetical protein
MPSTINADNGKPLGDPQRKSIPELAMWLVGLNIKVTWSRPKRPTDNPQVERMQRTSANWAEVAHCANREELQHSLDTTAYRQRALFKVSRLKSKTRVDAFPELLDNNRPYLCDGFQVGRIYSFLSKYTFKRKVATNGQITLLGQVYHIATALKRQYVSAVLDPETIEWRFFDQENDCIRKIPAKNFSKEHFWNLTTSQRTNEV